MNGSEATKILRDYLLNNSEEELKEDYKEIMKNYNMSDEDLIEERKRKVAIAIIECLDELWEITGETIDVTTTHYTNPKYFTVIVQDSHKNKIGINIHKLK